jgi:hypothetical protein
MDYLERRPGHVQTCNSQTKVTFHLLHTLHGVPQCCILFQQTLCRHTNFSPTDVVGSTSFGHETAVVRDIRTNYTKTINQSATNYLTLWRWALLDKQPVVQPLKIFSILWNSEGFLPWSQQPYTCPYTEPCQFSTHPILSLQDRTSYYSLVFLLVYFFLAFSISKRD